MAAMVHVYSPDGEPHKKTVANARDLVANSGWTWKPNKPWSPTEGAPYARPHLAKAGDVAQAVLDAVGGSTAKTGEAPDLSDQAVRHNDPIQVIEEDYTPPPPVEDEADLDVTELDSEGEGEEGAPKKTRAPRKPKPLSTLQADA